MIGQIPGLILLLILVVVFAWLAARAACARSPIVRWPGLVLTGLLALVFAAVGVVALIGVYRLEAPRNIPAQAASVTPTAQDLARAARFINGCSGCHSSKGSLPLDGASQSFFGPPNGPPFGTLYPPNLTPGGPLKNWSDAEIMRAIREGVDQNGRALLIMPSDEFHHLSDADAAAVVATLRAQPAVQHDTPPRSVNLLGTILVGLGMFPTSVQPALTQPVVGPPPGPTAAYGQYLVSVSGCQACHGQNLAGGTAGFGPPPGPNLTQIVPQWSQADFVKTIRTGLDPNGRSLRPDMMPWKEFSEMFDDTQLQAIWAYLHGLTPLPGPAAR